MPRLSKQTIAQTFKFDCNRYLRFELATKKEREEIGIDHIELGKMRPGVQLMIDAANKWEADKYQDLVDCSPTSSVSYAIDKQVDKKITSKSIKKIPNIFDSLRQEVPPYAIIEGEFKVPESVSPSFKIAHEEHGIELSKANPDIIWIRPYSTGAPLIRTTEAEPKYELHIIDVKMASEASLKHFTEVTFYAFALAEAIKEQKLDSIYQVSAKGLIWPGSHDNNKFRNLFKEFQAKSEADPTCAALTETLDEVPYEVYEIHVKKFLDERFLQVLKMQPLEASWHVSSKCQLCQYLDFCQEQAETTDHLSKIAWLNQGQADILRNNGIITTQQLQNAIETDSDGWKAVKVENYQINADQLALKARSKALHAKVPEIISERKSALMPRWADMNIFLTIHFDPGTGLTFAMGATRVYFKPGRQKDDRPVVNEQIFIVDKVDSLNPDTEKNRLIEFIDLVTGWYFEADAENNRIAQERRSQGTRDSDFGKVKAHAFFWNHLEVKQLLRMIERHMTDPKVVDRVELLIRLFPPDSILPPDAEAFKSQPGTVVKDVIRQLVGLPLSHDYTLLEAASVFFPNTKDDGTPYIFYSTYGFKTPLNDQIPFERAYELWKDNVFLKHYRKKDGSEYSEEEKDRGANKYTRDEIYEGIKRTIRIHLQAIQHLVSKLRDKCGPQLVLKKGAFSAAPITQIRVPETARQLITFQKLDAITHEIENRHQVSLPIDEKEARFISIRGLTFANNEDYKNVIDYLRTDPRYSDKELMTFTFSNNSKDAKIKEGEFLCALSNEEMPIQLDLPWFKQLDITFYEGQKLMNAAGITQPWNLNRKLSEMLQVTVVKLSVIDELPYLVLQVNDSQLFHFAIDQGLIDVTKPLVLDPFYKDFESKELEEVLRMIGGKSTRKN